MALTLRLLGGLTTAEIARAFLVPEATVAQRIVRAKRTLAEARVPFEVPRGAELGARLASVLEVIYLDLQRGLRRPPRATTGCAPPCARTRCGSGASWPSSLPDEAEVHGLVALMEIQASRARARIGPGGRADAAARPGPLALGPRARSGAGWRRWRAPSSSADAGPVHAAGRHRRVPRAGATADETDWGGSSPLYDALAQLTPSPVVELNRAVAVVDGVRARGRARARRRARRRRGAARYHLLPSVRGDLLARLGRVDEARAEFERAVELTQNESERRLLSRRAAEL